MDIRDNFNYPEATKQLINYYYNQCPGSLMPLFLLYLARTSKPGKELLKVDEKIRKPLDWKDKPEQKYCSPILSQFTQEDAAELAKTDPAGAHLLDRWRCNEMDHMSIVVLHSGTRLQEIREAFQKHDEALGDSMQKRRALFLFVQGLLQCPKEFLKDCYVDIANDILKHANVFDEFDDIFLARFERWILGDIKGPVFVPFARAPYAASMLSNASVSTESSGPAADLASMVSELIIKGNAIKKANSLSVAKPYGSLGDVKYNAVVLNYAHHSEKTDETSWHYCLKQMKNNLSDKAKYVGLIETKYLFKMVGKQKMFKEIIADCSLEAIVLLPRQYGMALISVNKAKKHPNNVKMVNLYNENLECPPKFFHQMVSRNSKTVSIETLKKEQTTIESFFEESIPQLDGFKVVPLGKYLKRIRKESLFGVSDSCNPEELSKVHIDNNEPYSPFRYLAWAYPTNSFSIYEPTYYLDNSSLLLNEFGDLEPRIYGWDKEYPYNRDCRPAILPNGIAFSISTSIYPEYIINELRKPYVLSQLNHWSASKEAHHSEDEILDLKIYVPTDDDPIKEEASICDRELNECVIPNGKQLEPNPGEIYRIEKCIGQGGFGITYLASRSSYWDDEEETVVLKEFFATGLGQESMRFDGMRVAIPINGDFESMKKGTDVYGHLVKFIEESKTLHKWGSNPASRLVYSKKSFFNDETNTWYYTMPFYQKGSLKSLLEELGPIDESTLIERVLKPISIAINTLHNDGWLHLDIKPDNVLIGDDDFAMLGDLGISQHYDQNGKKDTTGGEVGSGGFAHRLQYNPIFIEEFHPELDIYSFAMMIYSVLSGDNPRHFSMDKLDVPFLDMSDSMKEALRIALDPDLKTTPRSIQDFMHMLPGCEDMVFEDILPIEEDTDLDSNDFNFGDLEDLPYFT